MRLPGLTAIIALGIVLGLIHGAIFSIQPRANNWWWDGTMFMPYLPLYCTWFTLGVVAKRNDWLHELQQWPAKKKKITYLLTALAMFVSCVWTATGTTVLFEDPPPLQTYTNTQSDFGFYLLLSTFQVGTYHVLMITSLLLLFGDFCNFTNKYLRFVSDASYTAYITHHWFIIPLAMSYMRILLAAGQPLLGGWYVVDGTLSSYWLIFGGWVYTAVLGLPLTYGVSWCLAKLPGLNQIL